MICSIRCGDKTGTLIHGVVEMESNPGIPGNVTTCVTYDPTIHECIKSPLDYKVIGFRVFYNHLKRRSVSVFYKSKLFEEDLCVRIMFKRMSIFNRLIPLMLKYQVLTRDGKMYRLGVCP